LDGAQRVAAGRHESSEHVVDGVGQLPQGRGRDGGLFGERAGAGVADSQLTAELAHGLVAAAAAAADPAAGHGVAGHPPAEPAIVDPVADSRDGPHPLVPDAKGVGAEPVVQIVHLAGVELDVGAADAPALHVDHDLARVDGRRRDVMDAGLARSGDDERLHRGASTVWRWHPRPSMPSSMTSPGWSQTGGRNPMPTPGGVPVLMRSPGSRTRNWLR
jgi:hypothetical protein